MNKIKSLLFLIALLSTPWSSSFSQIDGIASLQNNPLARVFKFGPYLGLQRGKYTNLELGYELHTKAIKLIKPTTHGLNAGFDYNITENVLGFSIGYWRKKGRLGLTMGGNLTYKTSFEHSRFGIAPMIGYKLSWAHLQVGYNLMTQADNFDNYNTFFVSLRAVMINNRDFKWRKRKKKNS